MTYRTLEKTYKDLKEELEDSEVIEPELLNEFRIIRGGTALVLASKSKQSGDKVVQHARTGQSHLNRINKDIPVEKKLDHISEAMKEMFDCFIENRQQIGHLVGISLASVLISERSTKELTKILKQRR